MVKLRSGKSAAKVAGLMRSSRSGAAPSGPGSLLASLVAKVQVLPPATPPPYGRRATSAAAVASAIEAEHTLADRSEAIRLARHRRLAKLENRSAPADRKPRVRSEVVDMAAEVWSNVTGGKGVVLVDGEELEIPTFLGSGVKP